LKRGANSQEQRGQEQNSEEAWDSEDDQEHHQDQEQDSMEASHEIWFDHEKLEVYQEAITFIAWLSALLETVGRTGDVKDQLDRPATSIPLNIAEGNGKYSQKDRCRFLDTARSSALECAAGLDVLVAKAKVTTAQVRPGKERLQRIVRMLMGLIKRNSTREYDRGDEAN
jgi:four helix bundle protein